MLKKQYEQDFEDLWQGPYPNKSSKLDSYKSWKKHIPPEEREWFRMYIIGRARDDEQWSRGVCPHLSTFINNERWDDDYKRIEKTNVKEKRYYDVEAVVEEVVATNPEIGKAALAKLRGELH